MLRIPRLRVLLYSSIASWGGDCATLRSGRTGSGQSGEGVPRSEIVVAADAGERLPFGKLKVR